MIKRVLCFFICLLLFVNMIFPVAANQQRVYDDADLFTVQQETALEEKISQVKEQAALDLVIVTALSTGNKDAQAYADDFFDDGGFGMGDDNSGVLLLIDMGASEVAVSTTGYGIRLLSDARIDKILDEVVGFLIDGESALAAQAFVERVADYASQDVSQTVSHAENEQEKTAPLQKKKTIGQTMVQMLPISLLIGFLAVGMLYFTRGKSGETKQRPKSYRSYSSLLLCRKENKLVDKHVTKRHLPRTSSPSGDGSRSSFGGSSTHVSRSGRTHGGGSRSFGGASTHTSRSGRSHGGGSRKF